MRFRWSGCSFFWIGSAAWGSASNKPVAQAPQIEAPSAPGLSRQHRLGACFISGLIEGGAASRVHVRVGAIQQEARLLRQGRAYSVGLAERGAFEIIAVGAKGQTASKKGVCGATGRAQVNLQLPELARDAAVVEGRCLYLETGVAAPGAIVRAHPAVDGGHGRSVMREGVGWSTIADEEGHFSLPVKAGQYAVYCEKDGDRGRPKPVVLEQAERAPAGAVRGGARGPRGDRGERGRGCVAGSARCGEVRPTGRSAHRDQRDQRFTGALFAGGALAGRDGRRGAPRRGLCGGARGCAGCLALCGGAAHLAPLSRSDFGCGEEDLWRARRGRDREGCERGRQRAPTSSFAAPKHGGGSRGALFLGGTGARKVLAVRER